MMNGLVASIPILIGGAAVFVALKVLRPESKGPRTALLVVGIVLVMVGVVRLQAIERASSRSWNWEVAATDDGAIHATFPGPVVTKTRTGRDGMPDHVATAEVADGTVAMTIDESVAAPGARAPASFSDGEIVRNYARWNGARVAHHEVVRFLDADALDTVVEAQQAIFHTRIALRDGHYYAASIGHPVDWKDDDAEARFFDSVGIGPK